MRTYLNQDQRITFFHTLKNKLPILFLLYNEAADLFENFNDDEKKAFIAVLLSSLERDNGESTDSLEKAIQTYERRIESIALSLSATHIQPAKKLLFSPYCLGKVALNHIASLADHLPQRELAQLIQCSHLLSDTHFTQVVQKLRFSALTKSLLDRIVLRVNKLQNFDFDFLHLQTDFSAIHFFAEYNFHRYISCTKMAHAATNQFIFLQQLANGKHWKHRFVLALIPLKKHKIVRRLWKLPQTTDSMTS